MTTDIDAIRQREQAATEGPWKTASNGCIEAPSGFRGRVVASVGAYESGWPSTADAEFIAHARTDVPALLAKVDELTAELADERDRERANVAAMHRELNRMYAADMAKLRAALAEKDAQLTAANRRNDGLQADLNSATKANTAWANENNELKARLGETTDQAMADGWNRVADEMDTEAGTDTRAEAVAR